MSARPAPPRSLAWSAVGLALALAGPPLLALACHRLGSGSALGIVVGHAGMLALPAAVLAIARRREGTSWAALGLRRPDAVTVAGALALAAATYFVIAPLMFWVLRVTGAAGFAPTLAQLATLPWWLRATSVLLAGTVEELLYRGYAIERLSSLTRSTWLGAALATIAFALVHTPTWGLGPSLVLLIPGAVGTAVYVWRRDLVLNMAAHVITDAIGILLLR